jgi:hypothetical protein
VSKSRRNYGRLTKPRTTFNISIRPQMNHEEIINILKSGNFTVAYHDNSYCCLYEGKHDYENLPDKEVAVFYNTDISLGYCPGIVNLLVTALGGKADSI